MARLTACLTCLFGLPAAACAQGVVVAAYPSPAPVVTAYYAPAVTYYTPAPVVTSYATPAVSYYSTPAVVTYRYPLLRPWTTVVRVTPLTTVVAPPSPVVASYYAPAVVVP